MNSNLPNTTRKIHTFVLQKTKIYNFYTHDTLKLVQSRTIIFPHIHTQPSVIHTSKQEFKKKQIKLFYNDPNKIIVYSVACKNKGNICLSGFY